MLNEAPPPGNLSSHMIKLLGDSEKRLWHPDSQADMSLRLARLRLMVLFFGVLSMVLSATSSGAFSAFPQDQATDNILIFVSSAVGYLYTLSALWVSPPHADVPADEAADDLYHRPRKHQKAYIIHAIISTLVAIFLLVSFIWAAIADASKRDSCITFLKANLVQTLWNDTACRFTAAATAFAGFSSLTYFLMAYTLSRLARSVV